MRFYSRAVFVTITIGTVATVVTYYFYRRHKSKPFLKWQPVGEVKSLIIYPLKSARRLELKAAECTKFGLQAVDEGSFRLYDRCLSIYKEFTQETITSQTYPKMLLIEVTSIDENVLALDAPTMETLTVEIPTQESGHDSCEIRTFVGKTSTVDCGEEASTWISQYILETPVGLRLGYCDHAVEKQSGLWSYLDFFPILKPLKKKFRCDVSNYLLINESSIDDLTQKMPNCGVTVNNFRPNVVVSGPDLKPYSEDDWKWLQIGNAIFSVTKPCLRYSLTTINPDNITRAKLNEPLRTLKKHRKLKDISNVKFEAEQVVMGMYFDLVGGGGVIQVGDTVFVGTN